MGLAIQPTRRLGGKIATLIAVFALVVQPMYGLVAERVANAVSDPNLPHINLVSRTSDSVTIDFVNPTQNEFTFDYKVDGEGPVGERSELGDSAIKEGPLAGQKFNPRWHEVHFEKNSSIQNIQKTINATEKVEVRLAHGAEQKWYFDWQTFNVLLGAPTGLKTITPTNANVDVTNGFTKFNYIRNSWNRVEGAVSYNYEFKKPEGYSTYKRYGTTATQVEGEFHNASSPNGLYGFRVQAVDSDGVAGEWSDWSSVTYDTTPPEINHVAPLAGTAIGRVASFEFETTDPLSGVRNVNLHLMQGDTEKIVELKQDGTTSRWYATNVDLNSLANGDYDIVSRSTDNAGNTQTANSNHGKITLDKTRPTVTLVTPATTVVKGKLNVQVDATDDVRGLQSITANIYKDGALVKSSSSPVSGTSASHSATFDLPDGTYVVRYNARNSLGNISETKEFTVSVDNTAPRVSNIRYEQIINGNIGGEFKILVDAEDVYSDVNLDKKYTWARVHLGDKEWSYAFSKVEGTEKTYEAIVNTFDFVKVNNFAPGANITLRFADSLLNGSSAKPKDIQGVGVDNSGPDYKDSSVKTGDFIGVDHPKLFTVEFFDHTGVKSAGLTLINSATGKQDGITLSQNDDGSWSGDMSSVLAKLGDGVYNTNIRPVDLFGRPRSNTTSVKNVTVDTVKPTLKLNLDRKAYALSGDVVGAVQNPELETFDANFDRIELYRDDGTPTGNVWTGAADGKNRRAKVDFLKEGAYFAIAFDKAGNQSEEFHFTIDNTAPKITSVEFDEIRSYNGPNLTGSRLNSNRLMVTFTTNEPLKISGSQVGMRIPALSGIPATGWTKVQLADASTNKYIASIDLVNRTDTSNINHVPTNFFKDKFFKNINLYFQLADALSNSKSTYYAIDPATNKPIDGWTTDANDTRNYAFTLDNKAPVLSIVDQDFSKPLSNNDSITVKATDDSGVREIHANVRKVNINGTVEPNAIDGLKFDFDRNNVLTEVNHKVKLGDLLSGAGLDNGKYQLRITGLDTTLNNSGHQNFLFTVNNQAPKAGIAAEDIDSGDITNNKGITVVGTGTPSEYGTDIKTHYFELKTPTTTHHIYSFNNAANKTCTLNGLNECSFDLTNYYDIDGEYKVRYVVTDQQGLRNDGHQQPWVEGAHTATFALTVDTADPTVKISDNNDGSVSGHNSWKDARNIMVTVEDVNIGETTLRRAPDDSIVKTYINDGTAFSIGMGLSEGVYYLTHTDKAGNESSKVYFTISNKKPSIYDVEGLNTHEVTIVGSGDTDVAFKVSNGDSLAATVNQVMIRGWIYDSSATNNRGSAAFSDQIIGYSTGTYDDINLVALLGDKFVHGAKFVIMLQAKNTANVHDQQIFILEVDLQAPAVTINSYPRPFTTGTPTIEGTVDNTATGVYVSRDGGIEWEAASYAPGGTTWSFTYPPALANGNHTILARATDEHGNRTKDAAFATRTFTVAVAPAESTTDRQINTTRSLASNFPPLPAGNTIIDDGASTDDATEEDSGEVASASTEGDEEGEVKAAESSKDSWSLINLLLTIAVAAASIFALIGLAGKKEDRNIGARLLTVVPALGAGSVLLFVEDFSGQMSWVNIWTLLVGALLVVQMILLANTKVETE